MRGRARDAKLARVHRRVVEALAELERNGTLTAAQRERVAARLAGALAGPDRGSRLAGIVAAFGGLCLGVGVISLVAFHWEELGKPAKLALAAAVWLGLHAAGFWLAEPPVGGAAPRGPRGRYPRVGVALTLAGVLAYGAAIGVVAQVYHLTSEQPNALLLWWLASVPVLVWRRSRAVAVLVAVLFLVWAFAQAGTWLERAGSIDDLEGFAAFGALAFALAALLAALAARPGRAGALLAPLDSLAVLLGCAAAYAASFRFPWTEGEWVGKPPAFRAFAPAALAAGAALVVVALDARARGAWWAPDDARPPRRMAAVLLGACAAFALAAAFARPAVPLVANALLVGAALALAADGVARGGRRSIDLATALFGLLVVTRYFEYLWDRLEGAYAFLGTGVLLIGLGWALERRRRAWIARAAGRAA